MPAARQDEVPEYPFSGPFGGIQSEVPPSQIGNTGFAEVQNLLFRNSVARIIPAFTPVASNSLDSSAMGIFDFYDQKGTRHSGAFTQTKMYVYGQNAAPGAWVQIPAATITPGNFKPGQTFSLSAFPYEFIQTAVVGYKLFFSNITLPVQMWDGDVQFGPGTGYFTADDFPPPSPPGYTPTHIFPAQVRYLMELDFHLVVGNLWAANESDFPAPGQVRWSAAGDGMDWSSFSAGVNDLSNNLGPITGMTRIFQTGYIFQKLGVTQMIPTGNALAPFDFITMGASARGNNFPYSLASFAEQIAVYVARDDIFLFDGTQSQPIGQRPLDGNRRLGARSRILADLFSVSGYSDETAIPSGGSGGNNRSRVYAVISSSANGTAIGAYWLFIPELNKAWIYDFNEGNWTQTYFNKNQLNGPALGSFLAQQKTTSSKWPHGFVPVDSLTIADNSDNNGNPNLSFLDFSTPASTPTNGSINSSDGWYIRSGNLDFDDNRHPHSVNKLRIVLTDVVAGMQFNIRLRNEAGYVTPIRNITLGDGTGDALTIMVYLDNGITGKYITWELSGPPGVPFELVEITPYPILGGEVMTRCEVTVLPPPDVEISIIPGTATLTPNTTQQFYATVTGTPNTAVIWTALQGTITQTGLYTAPNVTSATSDTVTATSVADPTTSLSVTVTIVVNITVEISPGSFTLSSGQQLQFSATVTGTPNQAVTWSAVQGSITSAGLYTAPTITGAGVVDTVTATSVANPTASDSAQVSIAAVVTATVTVIPGSIALNPGQTEQFTASVTGITNQSVTWSLQSGALGTISTGGLYTAPASATVQSVDTVVATSVGAPTAAGLASVTITPGGIPVVVVSPAGVTLNIGQTQQFTATVSNITNQSVTWSLQPGTVGVPVAGTITTGGLYTAPAVITTQEFDTVVATSVGFSGATGVANVTLTPSGVPVVLVNPPGITLNPGQTQQFTATVSNTTNQNVTWSLQPGTPGVPVVGKISATGLYTAPASLSVQSFDTVVATSVAFPSSNNVANVTVNKSTTTQYDLVQWMLLSNRSSHHLVGDPNAPYGVQVIDTDSIYPSNYPRNCVWDIKNKLGNPWDVHTYDSNWITHWITEDGDAVDQPACQAANGTDCWIYAKAYKRYITPVQIMPRYFTPHTTVTHDNANVNDVIRTTNCEQTTATVHIGPVRGITTGPFKISWGGSIDNGSGTLSNGPNYDSVHGVDTIRVQYQYTGSYASGFADSEEYYYVLGYGQVAWYHFHNGSYVQKTVNSTVASGGAPVPNFPCGPGKSWFV